MPYHSGLNTSLEDEDEEIFSLIEEEKYRQFSGLELIASENFTSRAVLEANASCLTNKYSEGLPGARYYGGNEVIDKIERVCIERALKAFQLEPSEWGVNVQSYSGSTANFSALVALCKPHDRIMGLDLPSGGHLTHGYQTAKKKISSTSIFFESMPYQVDPETGIIDYHRLEENAQLFRPKLLICGASAYCREWDYARLRKIADQHGAYLMADIAHISGLIAGFEAANPFLYCDVVTTTTHKTLRGPRAGLIFFRRTKDDLEARVNFAVFPSCQGGPHNQTIAAVAVALKQVASKEFRQYAQQVRRNATALATALNKYGHTLVTGGTDNHMVLWDLRPHFIPGNMMEKICEMAAMTINKNAVPGDRSAIYPGGVRIGTPALTSRGLEESHFDQVAVFLDMALQICIRLDRVLKEQQNLDKQSEWKALMKMAENDSGIEQLRNQVETFSRQFPMPGFDPQSIKHSRMNGPHP